MQQLTHATVNTHNTVPYATVNTHNTVPYATVNTHNTVPYLNNERTGNTEYIQNEVPCPNYEYKISPLCNTENTQHNYTMLSLTFYTSTIDPNLSDHIIHMQALMINQDSFWHALYVVTYLHRQKGTMFGHVRVHCT